MRRNDDVSARDVAAHSVDGVLISPGPGHPASPETASRIVRYCAEDGLTLLGVCLGHQALGEAFGAVVSAAPELLHGRASIVTTTNWRLSRRLESPDRGPVPLACGARRGVAREFGSGAFQRSDHGNPSSRPAISRAFSSIPSRS